MAFQAKFHIFSRWLAANRERGQRGIFNARPRTEASVAQFCYIT